MKRTIGCLGLLMVILSTNAAQASEELSAEAARQRAAMTAFEQAYPEVRMYEHDGSIGRVYGSPFSAGASPEESAEAFVVTHSEMFGVPVEQLDARGPLFDQRHIQPVMYQPESGDYKFTLVYYTQRVAGVPVFRSDLRLLTLNAADFPLVWANNSLRSLGDFAIDPNTTTDPTAGKAKVEEEYPGITEFTVPELVIWAGYEEVVADRPALAFEFVGHNHNVPNGEPEEWLFVTDAATGEILYVENQILHTDVSGNVSGMSTDGPASGECDPETLMPMPYMLVEIDQTGETAYSDINGDFTIPNAGNSQVTVNSEIFGRWFDVNDNQGDETISIGVTPPGPADITYNAANSNEFDRAAVNCYIHSNVIRDMVIEHNPAYPNLNTPANDPFDVNVNIGQSCNAFYSPTNLNINFYTSGSGCPNTGFSTVVHHEYGHHLVNMAGSGQGQYGEGTGDVMAVILTDQPLLAIGWNAGNCNSALRNAVNNLQYPCSGGHACAPLYSGCVWDTRNALVDTEPVDYLSILQNLAVNSTLLHSGSNITPQMTIDWLTLDDNDGDIGNGTPHYFEIDEGFSAHNMPAPALQLLGISYPNGRPPLVDPISGADVLVEIVNIAGELDPDEDPLVHVSVDGGPFIPAPLTPLGGDLYNASLPAESCFATINWYVSAVTTSDITVTSPGGAPGNSWDALVATGDGPTLVSYDFETDPGFTVSGNATDGQWDRGVPIDCDRGDPPSDFDGSGQCWLTDNSAANSCNSDVDGGSTTLTTNLLDMSDDSVAYTVSYARWYSNTFGGSPNADIFTVEISNDNGANWTNLDTVGPAGPEADDGWFEVSHSVNAVIEPTGQMRVRFTASDLGGGSVVEAAIDDFRVETVECDDVDKTAPEIVHDAGQSTRPYSGYIDPRAESDNGVDVNLGIDSLQVRFSEEVRAIGGGPLSPASFSVTGTGSGQPTVVAVDDSQNPIIGLTLSGAIPLQEWTTVIASVEDLSGNAIVNSGDQGPGVEESDRVDVGYLPADVDQSGAVSPNDLLAFRQIVNDIVDPPAGVDEDFVDTDRGGDVSPFDLLAFRQLINGGGNATQSWDSETHPSQP